MKKKQAKKKKFSKKKKISEGEAFRNIEIKVPTVTSRTKKSGGIPKYVADRMAMRIFFTAGIPTIMGMSVFVVSYITSQEILLRYLLHQQLQYQHYSSY